MASGLFARSFVTLLAVGLPPYQPSHADPLSWTDVAIVVVGVVISFYFSVRLVMWLMVKISSIELFFELRRELGWSHKPPLDKS